MKLKKTLLAAMAATSFGVGSAAYADKPKIPAITGEPYNQAREMLIAEGWQPARTRSPNQQWFGQAKAFDSAGFWEIHECAGTGAAPCIVYFRNAYGGALKIVTVGESTLTGDDFPVVDNFELVKELPSLEVAAPVPLVVSRPQPVATTTPQPKASTSPQPEASTSEPNGLFALTKPWGRRTAEEWCGNFGKWSRVAGNVRDAGFTKPVFVKQYENMVGIQTGLTVSYDQFGLMNLGTIYAYNYHWLSPEALQEMSYGKCMAGNSQ